MIDSEAESVFKTSGFMKLHRENLINIVRRDTLNINSELSLLEALIEWSTNECQRQNTNSSNFSDLSQVIQSLLVHVRFSTMTTEELSRPEIYKFHVLMSSEEIIKHIPCKRHSSDRSSNGLAFSLMSTTSDISEEEASLKSQRYLRSMSESSSLTKYRTSTLENVNYQPRLYTSRYIYEFNVFETLQSSVKTDEKFDMILEILKGRVFVVGFNLAIEPFSMTKKTACLSVVLSATNLQTLEEKIARGTFLNSTDESSLFFPTPLAGKESENIKLHLTVKKAENVQPLMRNNEMEIIMPESKTIALRILPSTSSTDLERCLFKDMVYFY